MSEKKTKPIKRNPALVEFSKDHHFGLLLVWKIRQGLRTGIPPVRISNYVSHFFEEDLVYHFADEEKYLFTKLPPPDPARQRATAEHAEIRALAGSLKLFPDDVRTLEEFGKILEAHIRFEERELFNQLQSLMTEEQLLFLLKEIPSRPHLNDADWEDNFWERKPGTEKKVNLKSHAA